MPSGIPENIRQILDVGDCAGPASQMLVKTVEESLRVRFPTEYEAFLTHYGAALLDGVEVYGLVQGAVADEPPVWSDLRSTARHALVGMPPGLIPISDDGGDYRFYLRSGPTSAVFAYGPGVDGVEVAKTFFDFLTRANKNGIASLLPEG